MHINLDRAKYSAEMEVFMKGLKDFFREEEGVAIIEIVLILVILIGLVVVFKNKITTLNNKILTRITTESNKIL